MTSGGDGEKTSILRRSRFTTFTQLGIADFDLAPGMNGVVRAVVRMSIAKDCEAYGKRQNLKFYIH